MSQPSKNHATMNGDGGNLVHPMDGLPMDGHARSRKIEFLSLARPHMRAFHLSWFGFFLAFQGWFAFAPLMPTVKRELGLSKSDVSNANIASVSSTILLRIIVGPLCDRFGPRTTMASLLYVGSIPVMLGGLVDSATGLIVSRFFIGVIGAVFVPCQMWTTGMFATDVVGTANALVGGWGNLGGGFAYVFMPAVFAVFAAAGNGDDLAWRLAMIVPGAVCFVVAVLITVASDNWPTAGVPPDLPVTKPRMATVKVTDMLSTARKPEVLAMMSMYAACFGVELALNNVLGLYFYDNFKKDDCDPDADEDDCRVMTQATSGLVAAIFGCMNVFARAVGGFGSDALARRIGLHGRLMTQAFFLLGEGLLLVAFGSVSSLGGAIAVLAFLSVFTQSSEGSTFSLVPFVDPTQIGAVAGMVGAGGNIGAVAWSSLFKASTDDPRAGFRLVGYCVLGIGCSVLFLHVQRLSLIGLLLGRNKAKGKVAPLGNTQPSRPSKKLASASIATAMYPHTAVQDMGLRGPDSANVVSAMYPMRGWVRRGEQHEHSAVSQWR